MSAINPYESPTSAERTVRAVGELTLFKGIGFVLATMILFGAIGATMGLVISQIAPQYYAQLFRLPAGGQAVVAGAMLGLIQGGSAGIAVGVVLYGITAWLQVRLKMIASLREK